MNEMQDIGLIFAITTDKRWEDGKKFTMDDHKTLVKCQDEIKENLRPIIKHFSIPDIEQIYVNLFFGDYQAVKEMILDKGAELMSDFGEAAKKIEKKIEK